MLDKEVFDDKFIEDKAKYYNRTRMSLDLFCRKLKLNYNMFIDDMERHGYKYDERERKFILKSPKEGTIINAPLPHKIKRVSV